ncbi:MAG: hypothetical protein KatS3mg087_0534 [Patescibacteria group bacterium]|nr:MAG: hypothetical protein KatS3mg087_0534 [Patescibacteria group bacterium]
MPISIFTTQVPASTGNDANYELGLKFYSVQNGYVTGIRFWKVEGETLGSQAVFKVQSRLVDGAGITLRFQPGQLTLRED